MKRKDLMKTYRKYYRPYDITNQHTRYYVEYGANIVASQGAIALYLNSDVVILGHSDQPFEAFVSQDILNAILDLTNLSAKVVNDRLVLTGSINDRVSSCISLVPCAVRKRETDYITTVLKDRSTKELTYFTDERSEFELRR